MPSLKNIYIIGAQCTGKTTLFNALQHHFSSSPLTSSSPAGPASSKPAYIPELARTVVLEFPDFHPNDLRTSPSTCLKLQNAILKAQHKSESDVRHGNPTAWFLSDRSGLDPIVYTRMYVGEEIADSMLVSSEFREMEQRMKESLVLVCEAGCSWLEDDGAGVRLMPEARDEWLQMHRVFDELLTTRSIKYTLIPAEMASLQERIELVLRLHAANER